MEERARFAIRADESEEEFSWICKQFGISRQTGYTWLARYRELGLDGLKERSRRPARSPGETSPEWVERVLCAKRRHPSWGPKKLWGHLKANEADKGAVPSASTIGQILKVHGYVQARGRARLVGTRRWPRGLVTPKGPNEVWAVDFKGWFRTRDGHACYPLTVSDIYSRFVLVARGLSSESLEASRKVFERAFAQYGLPEFIRVDNGRPFASQGLGGLSRLSLWWLQLGISVQFIDPAAPHQNGAHERMHRTLKAETTRPPRAHLKAQQRRFNEWRTYFNERRPHEALQMHTPSHFYRPSARKLPLKLPDWEYPKYYEVRTVEGSGHIEWSGRRYFIGEAFTGVELGLREKDEERYEVFLGQILLGELWQGHPHGLLTAKDSKQVKLESPNQNGKRNSKSGVSIRKGRHKRKTQKYKSHT